ncbi:MAG: LysE family transporter [Prevotellaceae bacterium]|jgi:threonine/homoserine/homoserine lactone efflux protein|nr:LysE family transporter [Prevotellaceae bacterium]
MGIELFIKGIITGLGASIPLGPIGVLCIQRTINGGRSSGFFSGVGAACADTIFAAFAVLGLAIVQQFIDANLNWFLIGGGIIVALLGLRIYFTNPIKQLRQRKQAKGKFFEDFVSTFLLTLSNPGAVFLMLGILALVQLDLGDRIKSFSVTTILWGVMIGCCIWWFLLTWLVDRFRRFFRIRQLWVINRIAGVAIFILGIISVFEGVWNMLFN